MLCCVEEEREEEEEQEGVEMLDKNKNPTLRMWGKRGGRPHVE